MWCGRDGPSAQCVKTFNKPKSNKPCQVSDTTTIFLTEIDDLTLAARLTGHAAFAGCRWDNNKHLCINLYEATVQKVSGTRKQVPCLRHLAPGNCRNVYSHLLGPRPYRCRKALKCALPVAGPLPAAGTLAVPVTGCHQLLCW